MNNVYSFADQKKISEPNVSNLMIQDYELSFLGILLNNPDALSHLPDNFKSEHFCVPITRIIFETIQGAFNRAEVVSPENVSLSLPADVSEQCREIEFIGNLKNLPAISNNRAAYEYANTITTYYRKRFLCHLSDEFKNDLCKPEMDIDVVVESHEKKLFDFMRNNEAKKAEIQLHVAEKRYLDRIDENCRGGDKGVPVGFTKIEEYTGKLKPSNLYILAGRPAMGKTALATNMAFKVAQSGKNVLFFSLEMSAEELSGRIMSNPSQVPFFKLETGTFKNDEFGKTFAVQRKHEKDNIRLYIDDTGRRTVASILSQARRFKRQHGLDLIVIDHLHLMKPEHSTPNMPVREITQLTGDLKALAKELNIPVLVLSQLNRAVENRNDKRPNLADLRESGSIEQDADVVMFMYRDGYYKKNDNPESEVIISKNRQGRTGTAHLHFDGKFTKFSDLEE